MSKKVVSKHKTPDAATFIYNQLPTNNSFNKET
jgi:hypothetical protein